MKRLAALLFVLAIVPASAFAQSYSATLSGANFAGASLERARGLSQGRLNQACGDEATQLPPGLTIPHC